MPEIPEQVLQALRDVIFVNGRFQQGQTSPENVQENVSRILKLGLPGKLIKMAKATREKYIENKKILEPYAQQSETIQRELAAAENLYNTIGALEKSF